MRKLAIGLALASTALATPALARDGQWYAGVEGGAMIVEDQDLDVTVGNTTTSDGITIDHQTGYDFDGIVGYDFGMFRAEAEVGYREADPKSVRAGASGVRGGTTSTLTSGFTFNPTAGDINALSFMVNGLLDFGEDDGIQAFVGGGAGVARVNMQNTIAMTWLDDSDTGFAYQALAGIRAPISDNWDVGLKYRFFNVPKVDLVDIDNRGLSTKMRSHSLLGSLIYNFGGAEEVEEDTGPIVTPPPYIPPVEEKKPDPIVTKPVCQKGPYIVYFDWDKDALRPDAASTLDNAVAQYANCANTRVMLAGHADRSGSAKYNVGLSERRNATVRSYMQSKGVPAGVITTQGFGETQNRVATDDGVREQQNRRVEVSYGPGSGM